MGVGLGQRRDTQKRIMCLTNAITDHISAIYYVLLVVSGTLLKFISKVADNSAN
jgi:hypothetical protein